jgi:hypothetical protein
MRPYILTFFLALTLMEPKASALRLATYNLRYDSVPDNITVAESLAALSDPLVEPAYLNKTGEQPWSTRRLRVYEHILGEGVQLFSRPLSSYLELRSEVGLKVYKKRS